MIIMNNSLVSKIPIWMKFVGHKKLKKQQLGHGAVGDPITVMTSYL